MKKCQRYDIYGNNCVVRLGIIRIDIKKHMSVIPIHVYTPGYLSIGAYRHLRHGKHSVLEILRNSHPILYTKPSSDTTVFIFVFIPSKLHYTTAYFTMPVKPRCPRGEARVCEARVCEARVCEARVCKARVW